MIRFNLLVFAGFILLAILSRQNYSKYKDKGGFIYAMAYRLLPAVYKWLDKEQLGKTIRKLWVISPNKIEEKTDDYCVKIISKCLVLVFVFNLIAFSMTVFEGKTDTEGVFIQRDDYGGAYRDYSIDVGVGSDARTVNLVVHPLEYSRAEFYELTDKMFDSYEEALKQIQTEINAGCKKASLPECSKPDMELIWISDKPEIFSSAGLFDRSELQTKTSITLSAVISYNDMENSRDYELLLEPQEMDDISEVEAILYDLEKENRNTREISIPKEINGILISATKERNKSPVQIVILGIVCIILLAAQGRAKLRDKAFERDKILMELYPWFVNSLWVLLCAGVTVKSAIGNMVNFSDEKNILVLELEYAVNQINAGADEAEVYEELGQRLFLAPYRKLFSQIGRNIKIGSKDLLRFMETELAVATESRIESAKRTGEEASTKLVVPMVVMLLVVMLIIIFPTVVAM